MCITYAPLTLANLATCRRHTEQRTQRLRALWCDAQCASVAAPLDPARGERTRRDRGAERAGDVRSPLAPVEAAQGERPSAGRELEPEPRHRLVEGRPCREGVGLRDQSAAIEQGGRDRHAELACEVVVAG